MSVFEVAAILAAVADTWTTDRVIAAGGREAWPPVKYLAKLIPGSHRRAVLIVGVVFRAGLLTIAHVTDPGGMPSVIGWSLAALAFAFAAWHNYEEVND